MSNCPCLSINEALLTFSITLDFELEQPIYRDLVNDSRVLKEHDIFCAVIGTHQDGRRYIENAIEVGVDMVIAQCLDVEKHGNIEKREVILNAVSHTVAIVYFYQLDFHLYTLAKAFYQSPQEKMIMIGVTGTNGKTSTCQIIAQLLESCQKKCAVIGTNGAGVLANLQPIDNTTPGTTQLHKLLNEFVGSGVSHVAMEVSSHALSQRRVIPQLIDVAVFTNLSRDHLDYHKSMANYGDAKYQLFRHDRNQVAIINGDDNQAKEWLNNWPSEQPVIVFSRTSKHKQFEGYVQASQIKHNNQGVDFILNSHIGAISIHSPLMGDFNIDNLLAAICVLVNAGYSLDVICQSIRTLKPIAGRMEAFSSLGKATTIVDYAHTPDGLVKALQACRQHCLGELWVVFGCGGDRDKGKRSLMGEAAEANADHVIITNDNPRSESPENIAQEIMLGCLNPENITVQLDRQQAVLSVIEQAKEKDIVLLAGKGHEDYIIIGTEKINYNERQFVKNRYLNEAVS